MVRPLILVCQLATAACSGTAADAVSPVIPKAPVASVDVQPNVLPSLAPGGRQQLSATALDAKGQPLAGRSITWTANMPAVATVDAGGLVTAVSDGSGSITASSEGQSGSVTVTVRTPVARVELSAATLTLTPGGSQAVTATLRGASGNALANRTVAWTTTNPAVATVTAAGVINAIAPGQATITASSEGIVSAVTVTVRSAVATIAITQGSGTLPLGQDRSLTAVAQDAQGAPVLNVAITWSSSNATVASVDGAGRVTAVSIGSTTIAATGDGRTGSVTITVTPLNIRATPLIAGYSHSCALATDGNAFCWGDNSGGRLGDGGNSSARFLPAPVAGAVRFAALAGGEFHTCGIATGGDTYCWGDNHNGQLGDGSTVNRNAPQRVNTAERFTKLAGGFSHTCGLTAEGRAFCWGQNLNGSLGDGTSVKRVVPVAVATTTRFIDITASREHTCALATDRRAWCWGVGNAGQLGNGAFTASNVPVSVSGGLRFTSIATNGGHVCALREGSGEAACWGWNVNGQLGNGSTSNSAVPLSIAPGVSFRMLSLGEKYSCGIVMDETVRCWGSNIYGQLGNGTLRGSATPEAVPQLRGAKWIEAGQEHSCVALAAGAPQCWGRNLWGQLGTGTSDVVTTPTLVSGVTEAVSLGIGGFHACAVTADGSTLCWGQNDGGQLGDGTTTGRPSPVSVAGRRSVDVTSNSHSTCTREGNGSVWCWGTWGSPLPKLWAAGSYQVLARGVANYSEHICALTAGGAAFCRGGNGTGQLGLGNLDQTDEFRGVAGGLSFRQISTGQRHTCAVTVANAPYCWGWNDFGQLGTGKKGENISSPQPLSTTVSFSRIIAGVWESCGLDTTGLAYCWGPNWHGKVGDGTYTERLAPVPVLGGMRYADLTIAEHNVCAVTAAGDVWCWGGNAYGEFGNGERFGGSNSPVAAASGQKFRAIGAGQFFVCGIGMDQRVYCWGSNSTGVIGPVRGATPQPVLLNVSLAGL